MIKEDLVKFIKLFGLMGLFTVGILTNKNGKDVIFKQQNLIIFYYLYSGNIIIIVRKNHFQDLFNSLELPKIQII
ncbi:hypothetical protein GLOIN_2v1577395 [Rhizophagus irregularis DAOM 181602=DAOM 197198]|uniref:Uncharacterized protein n=1 Tax=Rhizophagus irregularis (strain DAOM 181602 / DAOM 197198 / MUCL 43194) TaxID=747089 RepID=A0A2P4Q9G6_RHIID|nr:hypothetical protein GLOIN_2v1577395 [Rhizophagus irregularis DAOM 181602=DAOM 197198]POG74284.1 hypothetical protein GLOIN_2v1577395 [Rhizophagus irregularis DAOM 181602=DAOM 197198]|eukprot:XP_025181150.1 hypothetical protein GLOIN_2v1577395 [Rhizophagus irregularis DAOM 181602=DAOM 197198]